MTICRECGGVALVTEPPERGADEAEWVEYVTVLEGGDESEIRVAQSLLEAEGIACFSNGEPLQGVWGFGLAARLACGPVTLQVRPEDAEAARALLAAKDVPPPEDEESPEGTENA